MEYLTEDKINRQTNKHNNSFLDRINKKLESLENIDRFAIYTKVEKKSDSFLDLYERLKALNSPLKNEREFEPHHRSSSTKTMTDNCYMNNYSKEEINKNLPTLKAINRSVDEKTDPIKERVTRIEDKDRGKIKKGMVKETLEKFERQKSLIETSKEDNGEKLCGKIETKEKVGKVKDMLKPKDNSTFKESLCRKLEEEEEIGKDELKKEK